MLLSFGLASPVKEEEFINLENWRKDYKLEFDLDEYFEEMTIDYKDMAKSTRDDDLDLVIDVSDNVKQAKLPIFTGGPASGSVIEIWEGAENLRYNIATFTADSQVPEDPQVYFELIYRNGTHSNIESNTFEILAIENKVYVYQLRPLRYETVNLFPLIVQVKNNKNKANMRHMKIKVRDLNDRSPVFTNIQSGSVGEHEPVGTPVMWVSAIDNDGTYPNNRVTYKLDERSGLSDKFSINPDTGEIRTKVKFDKDEKEYYDLTVIAEDGAPSSLLKNGTPNQTPHTFRIVIKDEKEKIWKPEFFNHVYTGQVREGDIPTYPILQVSAFNPNTSPLIPQQNITYFLDKNSKTSSFFRIDPDIGSLRLKRPLDYDRPNGFPIYNIYVYARDTFAEENSERSPSVNFVQVNITVDDINDNAPFLDMPFGLFWHENQAPGLVGPLVADDYDSLENGPPFKFNIAREASEDIKRKFDVLKQSTGEYVLITKEVFQKPEKYDIPIVVEDNKGLQAISTLVLRIGYLDKIW